MDSLSADVSMFSEQWHTMSVIEFSSLQTLKAILNVNWIAMNLIKYVSLGPVIIYEWLEDWSGAWDFQPLAWRGWMDKDKWLLYECGVNKRRHDIRTGVITRSPPPVVEIKYVSLKALLISIPCYNTLNLSSTTPLSIRYWVRYTLISDFSYLYLAAYSMWSKCLI